MDLLLQCVSLFNKGGPVMYLLALCSLIVVTIAVERYLYYRNGNVNMMAFIEKLQQLLERQRLTEALQFCEQTPGIVSNLAAQGLHAYQRDEQVENTMTAGSMLAAARLRENMSFLSAIVTMAPLLGLLGTVIGMINSFSVFNVQSGQPMAITGGVGEALIATAAGLVVAVMALSTHVYFSHRLDKLITDMEQITALLVIRLAKKKQVRREAHEIA
ncbi:MotA/TolQ/ExbB proton channel family protein [Dendrosporobacter sp. 1207_IL3150]|uniref:MotA/TolQ/ExbB proton channel family protein n=1 Tax=Dendrosporobacter sp. 1207_IL3150 TaxID=3084054 RepID=UPI002FD90F15